MATRPANTDEYILMQPEERRATLEKLRQTIRAAAPKAVEGFSYGMPLFRLDGKPLIWFAAWKQHYGLYPMNAGVLDDLAADVEGYETSKGTIRFPASDPLPLGLVKKLVQARIRHVRENGKQD